MVLICKNFFKFSQNWPNGSREEDLWISLMYFCNFVIISPLKRTKSFICINLNPFHHKMIYAKFAWNWPSSYGEEDLLISLIYFCYFIIISPWKRAGPFIWAILNPFHLRMICAKFGCNWAQWFWRRRWKCEKFTDRRSDGWTTDNRLSEKFHWACSSGELKKNIDQKCSSWD